MMAPVGGILQIRGQVIRCYKWGTIGPLFFMMQGNMFEGAIVASGWVSLVGQMRCPLQPQLALEPFEKWAIDFVGPFNPPSHQKVHILVCTDYVTKWVEAKAVVKATEQVVSDFLFEEIFARMELLER
jgi:hypothetical protein